MDTNKPNSPRDNLLPETTIEAAIPETKHDDTEIVVGEVLDVVDEVISGPYNESVAPELEINYFRDSFSRHRDKYSILKGLSEDFELRGIAPEPILGEMIVSTRDRMLGSLAIVSFLDRRFPDYS